MFDKEAIQELTKSEAISAADGALAHALEDDARSVIAVPSDFTLHDLERFLPARRRPRGRMTTTSPTDFASYCAAHSREGCTVFVSPSASSLTATAVLNLGTPAEPGHADDIAAFEPQQTAAYKAMLAVAGGAQLSQLQLAEFLEDWPGHIQCFNEDDAIAPPLAIAAVRKITIEGMRKQGAEVGSLSASRSTFESVQATSANPLPTHIYFQAKPYDALLERTFVMRVGIFTGDKPTLNLRVVNLELHQQEMAQEMAELVRTEVAKAFSNGTPPPVHVGSYKVLT